MESEARVRLFSEKALNIRISSLSFEQLFLVRSNSVDGRDSLREHVLARKTIPQK